jgi:hypothetical protein
MKSVRNNSIIWSECGSMNTLCSISEVNCRLLALTFSASTVSAARASCSETVSFYIHTYLQTYIKIYLKWYIHTYIHTFKRSYSTYIQYNGSHLHATCLSLGLGCPSRLWGCECSPKMTRAMLSHPDTYIKMWVCIFVCMFVCMYVYLYVYMYVCLFVCMYIYLYVCMCSIYAYCLRILFLVH